MPVGGQERTRTHPNVCGWAMDSEIMVPSNMKWFVTRTGQPIHVAWLTKLNTVETKKSDAEECVSFCLNSGLLLSNKQDLPALKWLSSMSREQRDLGSYLFLLSVSMQSQWSPLGANGSWGLAMIGGLIQLGVGHGWGFSPRGSARKAMVYLPQDPGLLGNRTESLSSWLAGGQKPPPVAHHWDFPSMAMTSQNPAQTRVCQRDCNTALHDGIVGGHQLSSLPLSGSHRHTQEAWETQWHSGHS